MTMRLLVTLVFSIAIFQMAQAQTVLIECDEAIGEAKSVLRVVSVPDGKVNIKEFDSADEAKFAYIEAIEKMNIALFKVKEFELTKYQKGGETYFRYSTFLTVDVSSGGGPMRMPQGDPGMPQGDPGMPQGH